MSCWMPEGAEDHCRHDLGQRSRLLCGTAKVLPQYDKFVTAEPGHGVDLAHAADQALPSLSGPAT
jgi:hypothetical protein